MSSDLNEEEITTFNHIIVIFLNYILYNSISMVSIRHYEKKPLVLLNILIGNLLQLTRYPLNFNRLTFSNLKLKKKRYQLRINHHETETAFLSRLWKSQMKCFLTLNENKILNYL